MIEHNINAFISDLTPRNWEWIASKSGEITRSSLVELNALLQQLEWDKDFIRSRKDSCTIQWDEEEDRWTAHYVLRIEMLKD